MVAVVIGCECVRFSFFVFLSFFLSLIYPLFDNAVLFAANIVWRHFPLWTIIMKTSKVKFSERLTFLGQHSAWTYLPGNKSKVRTNYGLKVKFVSKRVALVGQVE